MELIEVPGIAVNTECEEKYAVLDYARKIFQLAGRSKLALAACLHRVREKEYWRGGHDSFDQYTYEEFGYKPSTVSALIQVYQTMIQKLQIDPETIKDVSWAKLSMIVPVVDEGNFEKLIEVARDSTQAQLKKFLKDMRGEHVSESSSESGSKFSFTTNADQAEVIKAAIEKAENSLEGREVPPGTLYEMIFADYLISENEDISAESLQLKLSALERIYGVKITWEYL